MQSYSGRDQETELEILQNEKKKRKKSPVILFHFDDKSNSFAALLRFTPLDGIAG